MRMVNRYWLLCMMYDQIPVDFNNFSKAELVQMLEMLHYHLAFEER